MQAVNQIEALIKKGKSDDSQSFVNMVFNLMTNLHQPYSEIMNMPFPLVTELCKALEKYNKDMEKEMAKSRKRR